jgi:glycosyltransferase involved in cell wall biosynthesis
MYWLKIWPEKIHTTKLIQSLTGKNLHIVSLDVPYPVDYGGVFDLFYKIKALHQCGVNIHLHCFEYGRGKQNELDKYCNSVTYYPRKSFLRSFSLRFPFIVSSRANRALINNIRKDDFPVLLEGIHCSFYLYTGQLANRKVILRLHNVEYKYYRELAKSTKNIFRKLYFSLESLLLKKYEKNIANKTMVITVNEKDKETYQQDLGAKNIELLSVFHPFTEVKSIPGSGTFCLYHGKLSVPENEKAVLWLMKNVFNSMEIPFVIAGKNPSKFLTNYGHRNDNYCVVANPSEKEMDDLIKKAQLHVIPSFNNTGIKIKILNALYNGRFVITNAAAVEGAGLDALCIIAEEPESFKKKISELFHTTFTATDIEKRKVLLEGKFNNQANARQLMTWIW